jgi:hypothetical protein
MNARRLVSCLIALLSVSCGPDPRFSRSCVAMTGAQEDLQRYEGDWFEENGILAFSAHLGSEVQSVEEGGMCHFIRLGRATPEGMEIRFRAHPDGPPRTWGEDHYVVLTRPVAGKGHLETEGEPIEGATLFLNPSQAWLAARAAKRASDEAKENTLDWLARYL